MSTRKRIGIAAVALICGGMVFAASVMVFAASPVIKKTTYKGKGTFTVVKAKKATKAAKTAKKAKKKVSAAKAKRIALTNAVKKYRIRRSPIRDMEVEKDSYKGAATWEVSFEAKKRGAWHELEYHISRSLGKILHRECTYGD